MEEEAKIDQPQLPERISVEDILILTNMSLKRDNISLQARVSELEASLLARQLAAKYAFNIDRGDSIKPDGSIVRV